MKHVDETKSQASRQGEDGLKNEIINKDREYFNGLRMLFDGIVVMITGMTGESEGGVVHTVCCDNANYRLDISLEIRINE